jgi:hypothetical protein
VCDVGFGRFDYSFETNKGKYGAARDRITSYATNGNTASFSVGSRNRKTIDLLWHVACEYSSFFGPLDVALVMTW